MTKVDESKYNAIYRQCDNIIAQSRHTGEMYRRRQEELERELREVLKDLDELTSTKGKVSDIQSTFENCKRVSLAKLLSNTIANAINPKIANKFTESMNEMFTGIQYQGVFRGVTNIITKVEDEIYSKKRREESILDQLRECQRQIDIAAQNEARARNDAARARREHAAAVAAAAVTQS